MQKDILYSNKAPEPIGPYSQGIYVSWDAQKMLYTSGQVAIDPATGNFISGGIKEQTKQVMENLSALLKEAKSDLKNVVKTTVFMTDFKEFEDMNKEYTKFFDQPYPARSAVQVGALAKGAKLEIDCIAVKKRKIKEQKCHYHKTL